MIQLDVMPAALAAAGGGIKPERKIDGVDLLPLMEGKTAKLAPRWEDQRWNGEEFNKQLKAKKGAGKKRIAKPAEPLPKKENERSKHGEPDDEL